MCELGRVAHARKIAAMADMNEVKTWAKIRPKEWTAKNTQGDTSLNYIYQRSSMEANFNQ